MIPDLTLIIGSTRITPLFWSLIIATILASFSFWRQLKEDYKEEVIFRTTLSALASGLFLSRLLFVLLNLGEFGLSFRNFFTLNYSNNFYFAGGLFGVILAIIWQVKRSKGNAWEVLDALVMPFLYYLIFASVGFFLTKGNGWDLVYLGMGMAGFILYPLSQKNYRSFSWYKSGKTGFLFTFFGLIYCLVFLGLAFLKNDALYLYRFIWLFLALASAGALYYRSERDLKEDFNNLFKGRIRLHPPARDLR